MGFIKVKVEQLPLDPTDSKEDSYTEGISLCTGVCPQAFMEIFAMWSGIGLCLLCF